MMLRLQSLDSIIDTPNHLEQSKVRVAKQREPNRGPSYSVAGSSEHHCEQWFCANR